MNFEYGMVPKVDVTYHDATIYGTIVGSLFVL